MKSKTLSPHLLVVLGVISVSFSGPLVKWSLLEGATPVTIACLRMALSALFLAPAAFRQGQMRQVLGVTRRQCSLMLLAALMLALHYAAWMTSMAKTSTFASVALVCTQPLFVALLSGVLLGEHMPRNAIPGAVVAIAGAVSIGLFSRGSGQGDVTGDLLALLGAGTMAGHWLCGRAARRDVPALPYMACLYGITAFILLLMMPLMGGFALPLRALPGILLLAVGCTLGGHALFTVALGSVSADEVSIALLGEPVGAGVWALLLFGEQVSPPLIMGGGLVLVGLVLYLRSTMKQGRGQTAKQG